MSAMITTSDELALEQARQDRKDNKKLRKSVEAMALQMREMQTRMEYMAKEAGKEPPPPLPIPEKEPKLKKQFAVFDEKMTAMAARIEQIANTPIPGGASHLPPGIIDVSKAQDGRGAPPPAGQLQAAEDIAKQWQAMSPDERFAASYAVSRMRPYTQQR